MGHLAAPPHRRPGLTRPVVVLAAVLAALFWLSSCSHDSSNLLANRSPSVRIVRGQIVDGDTLEQVAEIAWIGWDDDGYIDHYQFATDIPESLVGGISQPPAGGLAPSVSSAPTVNSAPGPAAAPAAGISWKETTETSGRFVFQTALPETVILGDGGRVATGRYLGNHSFWVRAVDNQGATSAADRIDFTISNVMPRTTISTPKATSYASVGLNIYVSWTGTDPDKTTPDLQPAAYEYKLIPIASVFASSDPQYAVDVTPGPLYPWVRVPGSTTSIRLELNPESYWFVVRAIDALGAVENRFTTGINAVKLEASALNYDRPRLTVREARYGSHLFPDEGPSVELKIFSDECLRMEFAVDLSAYGGQFQGYNVAIDPPNLDEFGPESGFQGWTTIPRPLQPICFPNGMHHIVVVLARDSAGGVTTGTYYITVLPVPIKDREVLIVDDYPSRSAGGVIDLAMDAKIREMVRAAGYTEDEIYSLSPWGDGDTRSAPTPVTRQDLGRYRLIVWHVEGAGGATGNGKTALVSAVGCVNTWLPRYLQTGGAVWVFGNHVLGALTPRGKSSTSETSCTATISNSPADGQDVAPTDFLCTFMRICGGDFHQVRTEDSKLDGLISATPTPAAAADLMPRLEADSTAYNYTLLGGLRYIDAQFGAINPDPELEPLYTMTAVKPQSHFNNRAVAWRYMDLDPVPSHGPMAVFFFTLNEVKQGSAAERTGARGLARSMGDWFRRYMAPFGDPS